MLKYVDVGPSTPPMPSHCVSCMHTCKCSARAIFFRFFYGVFMWGKSRRYAELQEDGMKVVAFVYYTKRKVFSLTDEMRKRSHKTLCWHASTKLASACDCRIMVTTK